jgi:LAS superfamily LD-carboxypeptidase LdcB
MKLIRPDDFKPLAKKRKQARTFRYARILAVAGVAVFVLYCLTGLSDTHKTKPKDTLTDKAVTVAPKEKTGKLTTFTPQQFKDLARDIRYPNTQPFPEPPVITGNKTADERIRAIAAKRGFVLTAVPVSPITRIAEPRLLGDDLLQLYAAISWSFLKASARRDDIPLSLLSAYRSPAYQRQLFTQRLYATGATPGTIAAGKSDALVAKTLTMTAPPGYSRHHTGYTIDLACEDGSSAFVQSVCYRWIRADNYKIAKFAGWIPSYPAGAGAQGPEPEPWEYVWVGKDRTAN